MEAAGFTYPFLCTVAWDDDNERWTFDGGPIDGRPVGMNSPAPLDVATVGKP